MKKTSFSAVNLRQLLSIGLFITVLGAGAGFYYGLGVVRETAVSVSQASQDAEASGQQIEELRQLQQTLAQSESLTSKAGLIYATPDGFQSRVLEDMQRYAQASGMTVTGTDFNAAPPEGIQIQETERLFSVTLGQPVAYENVVRFLQLLEGNLPSIQPVSLTISRPDAPNGSAVDVEPILMKVTVR